MRHHPTACGCTHEGKRYTGMPCSDYNDGFEAGREAEANARAGDIANLSALLFAEFDKGKREGHAKGYTQAETDIIAMIKRLNAKATSPGLTSLVRRIEHAEHSSNADKEPGNG